MKKLFLILVVILLGVAPLYATQVNTISLTHKANTTIATIHVDGQVRVTHQTEVPKDGRGHRVIIDLLAANHNLGANKFDKLPDCIIKSIRSSQFAVSPEKITRVVFDIDQSPLYRIETDQSTVTVYFTDKNTKSFAAWNSKMDLPKPKAKKPTTVASTKPKTDLKNPVIAGTKPKVTPKTTKLAVTKPESNTAVSKVTTPKAKTVEKPKPANKPKTIWQDQNNDAETFAMTQRVSNNPALNGSSWVNSQKQAQEAQPKAETPPIEVKPAPPKASSVQAKADKPVKKEVNQKSGAVTTLAKVSEPKSKVKTNKSSERRPVVVVASTKTNAPETSLVVQTPPVMPLKSEMKPVEQAKKKPTKPTGQSALANKISNETKKKTTTVAQAKPKSKNVSTSRFRRNAGQIGIKGTMVVEFPQRLVIKYKGTKNRDPFETLINASRTTNNPIGKRVPNIDGLRLVGVIESDAKSDRALFEDTDGFGYILKSGDKVRNGYVLRVAADKVYFQIFEYGWSRTVALQLEE